MGAKRKLNGAYFAGSVGVALLAGTVTESTIVFIVFLAGMLIGNTLSGDIRR